MTHQTGDQGWPGRQAGYPVLGDHFQRLFRMIAALDQQQPRGNLRPDTDTWQWQKHGKRHHTQHNIIWIEVGKAASLCSRLMTSCRCVIFTPLGRPVVPPVYCRLAQIIWPWPAGQRGGAAPLQPVCPGPGLCAYRQAGQLHLLQQGAGLLRPPGVKQHQCRVGICQYLAQFARCIGWVDGHDLRPGCVNSMKGKRTIERIFLRSGRPARL